VATLEDTFRMMKGDEPVNTERLSVSETNLAETKSMMMKSCDGKPPGKVTSEFLDSVRDTLAEHRGEKVVESRAPADPREVKAYRDGLVDAGKKIIASLNAINLDHPGKSHDINTLNEIEEDMKRLISHLQMFPELRSYVKGKIKLPTRPKRQKRGF
jgi:hypothetical protein